MAKNLSADKVNSASNPHKARSVSKVQVMWKEKERHEGMRIRNGFKNTSWN
jgi:hypothetical protein